MQAHQARLRSSTAAEGEGKGDDDMQMPPQTPASCKPYLDFLVTIVKGFGGILELQYVRRWDMQSLSLASLFLSLDVACSCSDIAAHYS